MYLTYNIPFLLEHYYMRTILLAILLVVLTSSNTCSTASPLDNRFTLNFQYACRNEAYFSTCKGAVYWNGNRVSSITPNNYGINLFMAQVNVLQGTNRLTITGNGNSEIKGLTIDNVKLIRFGTSVNIVKNSGFESPALGEGGWK